MTQPRPNAEELIDAVGRFLESELLPELEGRLKFHARVAANVLDAVARELRDGPAAAAEEGARLVELLTDEGNQDAGGAARDPEAPLAGPGVGVEELSRQLARRIRNGEVALDDPDLLAHLAETARADVEVANPRHLEDGGHARDQ